MPPWPPSLFGDSLQNKSIWGAVSLQNVWNRQGASLRDVDRKPIKNVCARNSSAKCSGPYSNTKMYRNDDKGLCLGDVDRKPH